MFMFKCAGCEALKAENERLHKLISQLVDKVAGPVLDGSDTGEPTPPPPFEIIKEKDDEGREIVTERHTYGGE